MTSQHKAPHMTAIMALLQADLCGPRTLRLVWCSGEASPP
jgi:hypothetical protein